MELKSLGINRFKSILIDYPTLVSLRQLGCRVDVLMYLGELMLSNETFTYDKVAKACGYKNRSGAYKAIKKLCRYGFIGKIPKDHNNYYWNVGEVLSV